MKKNKDVNISLNASLYSDRKKNKFKRPLLSKNKLFNPKRILIILSFFVIVTIVITILSIAISRELDSRPNITHLETLWNSEKYQETYDYSKDILSRIPFNNSALTYHGYSSFYLALAGTNSMQVHEYIDEAINSLRLALLDAKSIMIPQLEYMLGKAYFHKNRLSAYYFYSDLAIKYLHSAYNNGYNASDIFEYLGLSYASLGMTRESIAYFTEALLVNDSDVLKIAIAEQYYKIENYDAAKPYLQRVKSESENALYVLQCTNLLGQIYFAEENYSEAQNEFEHMLSINDQSADAYYGMGLIYEIQGDAVKARAQWRRALDYEVNHQGARLKMK